MRILCVLCILVYAGGRELYKSIYAQETKTPLFLVKEDVDQKTS